MRLFIHHDNIINIIIPLLALCEQYHQGIQVRSYDRLELSLGTYRISQSIYMMNRRGDVMFPRTSPDVVSNHSPSPTHVFTVVVALLFLVRSM